MDGIPPPELNPRLEASIEAAASAGPPRLAALLEEATGTAVPLHPAWRGWTCGDQPVVTVEGMVASVSCGEGRARLRIPLAKGPALMAGREAAGARGPVIEGAGFRLSWSARDQPLKSRRGRP